MKSIVLNILMILTITKLIDASPDLLCSELNRPVGKPKSTRIAYCWSLGCTFAPIVIPYALEYFFPDVPTAAGSSFTVAGVLVGPSTGHFYAGQWRGGLVTIGVRLAFIGVVAFGYNMSWSEPSGMANFLDAVGLIGFVGTIGYDLITIPRSVRKYNANHGFQIKSEIDPQKSRYSFGFAWQFK
jgi:hypothetical protein